MDEQTLRKTYKYNPLKGFGMAWHGLVRLAHSTLENTYATEGSFGCAPRA